MQPILELKHVSLSYHSMQSALLALLDINFAVYPGEFTAIVGPSGCGKSTLLNLISGLLPLEGGEILYNKKPLTAQNRPVIGYMLQKDHLFEWRSIYKNVLLGLEIQHKKTPENLAHIDMLLKQYGLESFKNSRPSQLSGGMRQRAALIRTLALRPELLLLDEPFSALDYQTRLNVSDDIGRIIRRENITAILVTHDISEAVSMADRVLVLSHRPAAICADIPIDLGMEPAVRTPMESRNAAAFKTYFNRIWKELNQNE